MLVGTARLRRCNARQNLLETDAIAPAAGSICYNEASFLYDISVALGDDRWR